MDTSNSASLFMGDFDAFFDDTMKKTVKSLEMLRTISGEEPENIASLDELGRRSLIQDYKFARQGCSDKILSLIRTLGLFVSSDMHLPKNVTDFDDQRYFDTIQDISELCLEDVELFLSARHSKQGQSRSLKKFEAGNEKFNTMLASTHLEIDCPQKFFSVAVDNSRTASTQSSFNQMETPTVSPPIPVTLFELHRPKISRYRELNINWVGSERELEAMLTHVDECAMVNGGYCEIGVDIEHHSILSFQGFICLIQISTRDMDFIVDALALRSNLHIWSSDLIEAFRQVFENSNYLKILHGSSQDVIWLQQDFGIYVRSMFDTFLAAKYIRKTTRITFESLSLSSLVRRFVHNCHQDYIDSKPVFQLADWRQRPLPIEHSTYASFDSFYLLEIFDKMIDLIGHDGIVEVVADSWKLACSRFKVEPFDPSGYKKLGPMNSRTDNVTAKIYRSMTADTVCRILWNWRDEMARKYDIHLDVVLSPSFFSKILKPMINVEEACLASLLRLCTDVAVEVTNVELEACFSQIMGSFSPIPHLIEENDLKSICSTLLRRKQVTISDKAMINDLSANNLFFAKLTQTENADNSQPTIHSFSASASVQSMPAVVGSFNHMRILEEEASQIFMAPNPTMKAPFSPRLVESVRKMESKIRSNKQVSSNSITSQYPSSIQEIYDTSKRKRTVTSSLSSSLQSVGTSTESIQIPHEPPVMEEITDDNETVVKFLKDVNWLPQSASSDVTSMIDDYTGKPSSVAQSVPSSNIHTKKSKTKKW